MKTLAMSILLTTAAVSNGQTLDWVNQIDAAYTNTGYDITTDATGNVYIAGQFSGYTDFDPTAGTFGMTSIGIFDAFAAKYSPSGNLLWAVQLGGAPDEGAIARGIALDSDGNVLIIGDFTGTADFDPGAGTTNLTSFSNDVFICKLTSGGAYVWAKQIGGSSAAFGMDVATDSDGNVYTTGSFQNITDFDPGAATYNLNAINGDGFLSKLDADGNFVWAFQIGSTTGDSGNGIYIDELDQIYFVGSFGFTADFDPSAGTYMMTSAGGSDPFLMKVTTDATLVWAISFGGEYGQYGYSVVEDVYGDIYVCGVYEYTCDFDPSAAVNNATSNGEYDMYVSKFTPSGNFIWSRQIGGADFDFGMSIATDPEGAVYLGGIFQGTVDMDPGAATNEFSSVGNRDMMIEKLDSAGNFVSVNVFGGDLADNLKMIHVDDDANIYATGEFNNEVDFDPGIGTVTLTSTGQQDAFILKLKQNSSGIFEQNKVAEIAIYPNPVRTELFIQSENQINEILIYTVTGELVKREITSQLSVEDLNPGLYILEVRTDAGTTQTKFMKI